MNPGFKGLGSKYVYRAKQITDVLEDRFGVEQIQKLKILLANSTFRKLIMIGGCVTLESILARFYSIVITLGSAALVTYYDEGKAEKQNFHLADDILNTGVGYAALVIRRNMKEARQLTKFMLTLPFISVYKLTMKKMDQILHTFQLTFKRDEFEGELVPALRRVDDDVMISLVDEWCEFRDEPVYEMELIYRIFLRLRYWYDSGKYPCPGEVPIVSAKQAMASKVTCKFVGDLVGDFAKDMLQEAGKTVLEEEGYYVLVIPRNWFSIIGGTVIDYGQLKHAKFARRKMEEGREPMKPSAKMVLASKSNICEADSPTSFLLTNFHADVNKEGNAMIPYGGSEALKEKWDATSKTFRTMWKKPLLASTNKTKPVTVEEAIKETASLLSEKVEVTGEALMYLAAGRLCAMKGNFSLDKDNMLFWRT